MRTAVRPKVYVTLLAVVAAAAVWPSIHKAYTRVKPDEFSLTLIVSRTATGPPVDVTYTVNRGDGTPDFMTGRRWSRVITVRRTDHVTLRAYQAVLPYSWRPARDKLTCKIKRGGVLIDENERADIGSIRCYYPVR